jgi:hypothetical protein
MLMPLAGHQGRRRRFCLRRRLLLNQYLLNGILLPIILFSILYLVNQKRLMGGYTYYNVLAYSLMVVGESARRDLCPDEVPGFLGIQLLG